MGVEINEYIVADSEICGGTPTFKNTRIMVWQVIELLAAGISSEEIITKYFPELTEDHIKSSLGFAAQLVEKKPKIIIQI